MANQNPIFCDPPLKGQHYIQDCKAKLLHDVTMWSNRLSALTSAREEIAKELSEIINQNFKSLEE